MTPELRGFLSSWLNWVEEGAPDYDPFVRGWGLCSNSPTAVITRELEDELIEDFGDRNYPFGVNDYYQRRKEDTQHLCPKRLAWVKSKLGEIE